MLLLRNKFKHKTVRQVEFQMLKAKSKLLSAADAARCPPLDPRTLGRPFHLLDDFCRRLKDALGDFFEQRFNRRYDAAFNLVALEMQAAGEPPRGLRWRSYRTTAGTAGVALERPLLLSMLDYRYGGGATDPNAAETETEHRLAQLIGGQLVELLQHCSDPAHTAERTAGHAAPTRVVPLAPTPGSQLIRVELAEAERGLTGLLWLALDEAWLNQLFAGLAPRASRQAEAAQPLASTLRLRLEARLLSMEVPLGTLLDLKPGDVLPARVNERAEVRIGPSSLFTAAVAEHDGKLWLTSFADVE
jgi:flagellar motor switch protein FliM